jgi:murein DD-endopeptidase MepM/ murein hydrolase activator NlpD
MTSRRVSALVAVIVLVAVMPVAAAASPAFAQEGDPTTTTAPAPDPTTTTEPAPDTTTTLPPDTTTPPDTAPDTTTTLPPDGTTTTAPSSTTTTDPGAAPAQLDPGEALVPRPEFGSLTAHQRALVQQLQDASDEYARRRGALVDLGPMLSAANDALQQARAAEEVAVTHEVLGFAAAAVDANDTARQDHRAHALGHRRSKARTIDQRVTAFDALRTRLTKSTKAARLARVRAQAEQSALSARFTAQSHALGDALAARKTAESAIEDELGPDAVRALPDGITATLASEQAGEPDPIVIGGIALPIPGAAVASPFGLRNDPLSNGAGFHPGIDLAAGSGTPIHAAADGVVVAAGDCGGYGNCVVIDHGLSLATLYGHQSQLLVTVGERVTAGQVVGLVGSTGLSTGPHLHFEVRLHGLPIDPVLALPAPAVDPG